jgi:hypothetical protein
MMRGSRCFGLRATRYRRLGKPATPTLDPAYYSFSSPALKGLAMIVGTAEPAPCHAAATERRVQAPFANVPLPRFVRVAMWLFTRQFPLQETLKKMSA